MADETDIGFASILGGFDRFAGGVEARPQEVTDVAHVVTNQQVLVSVPHINGDIAGQVAGVDFWANMQQLELAPPEDRLNSRYTPNEDPSFDQYKRAVEALGDEVPVMTVLPAHRDTVIAGRIEHIYIVYDEPALYYALQALGRSRVRVKLSSAKDPGAILLRQLSLKGQLHREPSMLELCFAAKRLSETYDYTYDEIAEHLAKNSESGDTPSRSYVTYLVMVANLPPLVQDLLHRGQILWTHARRIAETFGGDELMCNQLATLASHGSRMTVAELNTVLERLKGRLCHLEENEAGVVHVVHDDGALKLVADRPTTKRQDIMSFPAQIAKPANIHRESSRFTGKVVLIPGDTPSRAAVAPQSFQPLIQWLNERQASISLRDTEAVIYGFMQALFQEAQRVGVVNAQGVVPPTVDSTVREA